MIKVRVKYFKESESFFFIPFTFYICKANKEQSSPKMSTIRQNKIEVLIQKELAVIFQKNTSSICLGQMVSVTVVRVSADLSFAKCYLSVFPTKDKLKVLESIQGNTGKIKKELGSKLKNFRKTPTIAFYIDDSIDYAENIENLLNK